MKCGSAQTTTRKFVLSSSCGADRGAYLRAIIRISRKAFLRQEVQQKPLNKLPLCSSSLAFRLAERVVGLWLIAQERGIGALHNVFTGGLKQEAIMQCFLQAYHLWFCGQRHIQPPRASWSEEVMW